MEQTQILEKKIDDLISSLGGLERLRDLSRLSSLDHLVNLHLLSHLTKLDKIEGLVELDKLKALESLQQLKQLDKLENLNHLKVVDEIKNLDKLSYLKELKNLNSLGELSQLTKLDALQKLDLLESLTSLDKLDNLTELKELARLDHLSYLKNLDRLQDLTLLTKLDQLQGFKELMENNKDLLSKLKHLDALDNLSLLGKLSELENLDKLDELKNLDKITQLMNPVPRLPALPEEGENDLPHKLHAPQYYKKSFFSHFADFSLDLIRSLVLAAIMIAALQYPQGRKTAQQAVAFLGFGEGVQVNWALETLWNSPSTAFDKYWNDFIKKLDSDVFLVLEIDSGFSLKRRYESLNAMFHYDFSYENNKLDQIVRKKVRARIIEIESKWTESINVEIGQLMLKQGDSKKLGLWNQLKDLSIGGRWGDLLNVSLTAPDDIFAQQASIIALAHLKLNDSNELKLFFTE